MSNKRINNFGPFQVVKRKEKIEKGKKKKDEDEDYKIKEAKSQQVRWTKNEDEIYMKFIKENSSLFNTENMRRTGRVFMRMSIEMRGLRTPNQCKSHHQKMQKVTESGQLNEIINYLEMKYSLTPVKDTKTKEIEEEQKSVSEKFEENGFRVNIVNSMKGTEILVLLRELKMDSW